MSLDSPVVIVRVHRNENSLGKALDLCQAFQGVSTKTQILIKPNLVFWDDTFPFPLYGLLTTTRVVEAFLIYLKERGFEKITIGEGAMMYNQRLNDTTKTTYQRLGYYRFIKRYGIKLIDFFDEPFSPVNQGGVRMGIAKSVLETEFLVTLPVLKTHGQTKASLGIKNLKGTVNMKTRRFFHSPKVNLEHCIALLGQFLRPKLSIIDGIYGLERGPFFFGQAHRFDTILISKNPLAADAAACHLMGIDPEKVTHLQLMSQLLEFPMGERDLKFFGDPLRNFKKNLQWDPEWMEDGSGPVGFKEMGIEGINIPKYDNTLCTGCSFLMNPLLVMLLSLWKRGKKSSGFEVLTGKVMQSHGGYEKTFLLGQCMIKANRSNSKIRYAIPIPGCPPTLDDLIKVFKENGVEVDLGDYLNYRKHLVERYKLNSQFDPKDFFE